MLTDAFATYLRDGALPSAAAPLADALSAAGLEEAEMLRLYNGRGTAHHVETALPPGGTTHIGPSVPPDAVIGDRWFDTCELSLMILLPKHVSAASHTLMSEEARTRNARATTWFSLHPVRRFQYRAFLQVASLDPEAGAFDTERLTSDSETSAITNVTCSEAGAYLYWFGKHFPLPGNWLEAQQALNLNAWSTPAREWIGESGNDDTLMVAVSPSTLHLDPDETLDNETADCRMLYPAREPRSDVTFRSAVHMIYGLRTEDIPSQRDWIGRVLGRLRRPR